MLLFASGCVVSVWGVSLPLGAWDGLPLFYCGTP